MKKLAIILLALSLSGCAMTPEDVSSLNASLNSLNESAQQQQAMWSGIVQSQQAGMAATQQANREWTQKNSEGVIVHCIQVGSYITCK